MNRVKKSGMIGLKIGGYPASTYKNERLVWPQILNWVLSELHSAMLTLIRIHLPNKGPVHWIRFVIL
jgi:hypothetical protein